MRSAFPGKPMPRRTRWPWPWAAVWEGLQRDFADPSKKIELVKDGFYIIPTSDQTRLQMAFIAGELRRLLPAGVTFTWCAVETGLGVLMADVACASPEFVARHGVARPLARAPELCVEVVRDRKSGVPHTYPDRAAALLDAGAEEYWLVDENGEIVERAGARTRRTAGFRVALPPPGRLQGRPVPE